MYRETRKHNKILDLFVSNTYISFANKQKILLFFFYGIKLNHFINLLHYY